MQKQNKLLHRRNSSPLPQPISQKAVQVINESPECGNTETPSSRLVQLTECLSAYNLYSLLEALKLSRAET